jgi:hypothetical protein
MMVVMLSGGSTFARASPPFTPPFIHWCDAVCVQYICIYTIHEYVNFPTTKLIATRQGTRALKNISLYLASSCSQIGYLLPTKCFTLFVAIMCC